MAQSINNTVQSPNKQAGLLGLTPKPVTAGFSPTSAGNTALPSIGQGLVSSLGTPRPVGQTASFNPTPTTSLPAPQMGANIQSGGTTALGTAVPKAPLPQVQPQTNALATFPAPGTGSIVPPPAQSALGSAPPAGTANGVVTPSPIQGLFPSVASSLAAKGNQVNPITTDAVAQTQALTKQIADTRQQEAQTIANQAGPIPQGDITGRQAVARNLYETKLGALSSEAQAESNIAGIGNTVQNTQQSALSSAGGLTAPQVTSYGQTSFDPTSNTFNGGGSLPPEVMQQYAQMAASGQYSAIPSFITSNPVLNAQLNVAAKAFNPNYTPIGAAGASGVLQGIPALQSANTAADGIKNQIQAYIQSNPQLNASDLAAGNILQQWIQGKQLTDPKYQTLFNYLDEYTNTLAPILGVGGNPTNLKTQIAQGFINSAASGQSISQVLNSISVLASNKITDLQRGAQGQGTAIPSATSGTGSFAETW